MNFMTATIIAIAVCVGLVFLYPHGNTLERSRFENLVTEFVADRFEFVSKLSNSILDSLLLLCTSKNFAFAVCASMHGMFLVVMNYRHNNVLDKYAQCVVQLRQH